MFPDVISSFPSSSSQTILGSVPKNNFHCHLGGEIPRAVMEKYASKEQLELIHDAFQAMKRHDGHGYEKAFTIFPLISQIINSLAKLEEATHAICERMKSDNVQLVLMRTGLKSLQQRSHEEYLQAVLRAIKRSSSDHFSLFLLLSLKRSSTLEMAKTTIDLALAYRHQGVIGIDISDKSTEGDIRTIIPELQRAKREGLFVAVHMGEDAKEEDQMVILEEVQPDLIDHGVQLTENAVEWIMRHHVPVTLCLSSSVATEMHPRETSHPWIARHLQSDHPIHFGTDDSTIFNETTMSCELSLLLNENVRSLHPELELARIKKIATDSLEQGKKLLEGYLVQPFYTPFSFEIKPPALEPLTIRRS